jgi:hypothetical protein
VNAINKPAAASQLPLEPNKRRRIRSKEPKPFTSGMDSAKVVAALYAGDGGGIG